MNHTVLIAITDPILAPEATHAAAAAGVDVITCTDPRDIARHATRCNVIVCDTTTAAHVAACQHHATVYFLAPDPGPIDFEQALRCHATAAFILPAESEELLAQLTGGQRMPNAHLVGDNPLASHPYAAATTAATPAATATATAAATAAATVAPTSFSAHHHTGAGGHRAQPGMIGVIGASGGLGASTFAASLARTRMSQLALTGSDQLALLVDAKPQDGGIDLLLGLEQSSGARWPDINLHSGSVHAQDLATALPTTIEGLPVLSGARASANDAQQLTRPLSQDGLDEAVAALGSVELFVDGLIPTGSPYAVVLIAPEVRSAAAAAYLADALREQGTHIIPVVRHRGWSSLGIEDIENIIHADVIAEIPHIRRLARTVETTGLPDKLPSPLCEASEAVLAYAGFGASRAHSGQPGTIEGREVTHSHALRRWL